MNKSSKSNKTLEKKGATNTGKQPNNVAVTNNSKSKTNKSTGVHGTTSNKSKDRTPKGSTHSTSKPRKVFPSLRVEWSQEPHIVITHMSDLQNNLSLEEIQWLCDRDKIKDANDREIAALVVQTWEQIILQVAKDAAPTWRYELFNHGLVGLISICNSEYYLIVTHLLDGSLETTITSAFLQTLISTEDPVAMMQCIMYPTRFSLEMNVKELESNTWDDFNACQKELSLIDTAFYKGLMPEKTPDGLRVPSPAFSKLCEDLAQLYDTYFFDYNPYDRKFQKKFYGFCADQEIFSGFSTGSTMDGKDKYDKYLATWATTPLLDNELGCCPESKELDLVAHPITVPKNCEKRRMINMYAAGINALGLYHLEYIRWYEGTHKYPFTKFTYMDQSDNRFAAYLGSLSGEFCTIDLKNGSDRAVNNYAKRFMTKLYDSIEHIAPRKYERNGRVQKCATWLLSGHPMTYNGECHAFAGPAILAIQKCIDLGLLPKPKKDTVYLLVCGDDLVVRVEAVDTVIDFLEKFGFKVNMRKTFTTGHFKESCGGYYVDGRDVTPVFFPRKVWKIKDGLLCNSDVTHERSATELNTTLMSAISLANRLRCFPMAQAYAVEFILKHIKKDYPLSFSDDVDELGVRTALFERRYWDTAKYQETESRWLVRSFYVSIEDWIDVEHAIIKDKEFVEGEITLSNIKAVNVVPNHRNNNPYSPVVGYSITVHYEVKTQKVRTLKLDDSYAFPVPKYITAKLPSVHTKYEQSLTVDPLQSAIKHPICELIRYQNWLRKGPQYDEPILELLHVSSKRWL